MGIITGAKILTSASPTMDSPTTDNLTTTTLTSSGTGTGYFIQRVTYPGGILDAAGTLSHSFTNSICDANTMLFIRPIGWNEWMYGKGGAANGSCLPHLNVGSAGDGKFTMTSSSAASTALVMDVVLINY